MHRIERPIGHECPALQITDVGPDIGRMFGDRHVQGVERIGFTCEHCGLEQRGALAGRTPTVRGTAVRAHQRRDGEPTGGQRPCLVGTDHRCRSERLDSGKSSDERPVAGELSGPECQVQGVHHRELLWNGGDTQADPGDDGVAPAVAPDQFTRDDGGTEDERNDREHGDETSERPLQGRGRRTHRLDQAADSAIAGGRAGRGHPRQGPSGDDRGARPHGGLFGGSPRHFRHRHRLTREGRFVDRQLGQVDQPCVGGHDVPLVQPHQIADDDLLRPDHDRVPVTRHERSGRSERPQRLEGSSGPALENPAHGRDGHQGGKGNCGVELLADQKIGGGGHQEQRHHRIGQRSQQLPQSAPARRRGDPIRSIGAEAARGIDRAQPLRPLRDHQRVDRWRRLPRRLTARCHVTALADRCRVDGDQARQRGPRAGCRRATVCPCRNSSCRRCPSDSIAR